MSTFQILHISDLHINTEENFDRSVVLDPLIKRVEEDLINGLRPEIVIVTGDIACKGIKPEYEEAKKFFDDLLSKLKLSNDRLFIVPGNHDVYRKKYRPTEISSYKNMKELNDELENEDYREDLLRGMEDYFKFIETHYPHLKSKHGKLIPFVNSYNSNCRKKIGLVGLNSAWMCRKSPDEGEIAIGEYQMKMAMEELKEIGEYDLILNIFHHPLIWLWSVDRKICKKYFNNTILFSGHLHETDGGYYKDLECSIHQFQTGGAYVGSESPCPNRYQHITFDWNKYEIRLLFRKFDKEGRKWCIEAEKGDDGVGTFKLKKSAKRDIDNFVNIPEMPQIYLNWLKDHCAYMEVDRLLDKSDVIQINLPEIFIPLYTMAKRTDNEELAFQKAYELGIDIEGLIARNEYLLIEGHPGSGKTTLLKHLAYNLTQGESIEGLDDFLPVLIFLKDLKEFFEDNKGIRPKSSSAEALLSFHFNTAENGLDIETLKLFCKAKKAIFLLDGLDEIEPTYRDIIVNSFADFRIQNDGIKVVFSGRPHGLVGATVDRFGDRHVKILPLDMKQVEEFIKKWFRYVYSEGTSIGKRNAIEMISEVKSHPAIDRLIDNPLMLTAICILYHDGKELPGQRAELYKKFIDNLLHRRFGDPEMVHGFLMKLAFEMHSRKTKGADRAFAIEIMKQTYKKYGNETGQAYNKRIDVLFDEIEPKSGLLKLENGEYTFWHLTFQEFLTARFIVNNSTDYNDAIREYWDNDWYNEVIELYIGYLSIENKKWANQIIETIVEDEDKEPYKKWLLASKSMIDIHKKRRDDDVLNKSRKCLFYIIDNSVNPIILVEAGEILGWLGDTRNLKDFLPVTGGKYTLSKGLATIKPFEIGKHPVTNSWFGEFVQTNGYENRKYWSEDGEKWLDKNKADHPIYWNERKWKCPNAPVVGVSWYEAYAFTRWLTAELNDGYEYRLPDENEREAAAAGIGGRKYPWGDEWDNYKCNNSEIRIGKTSPVGIFKEGNTPEGISDLSGNVWEWTNSWYNKSDIIIFMCGGSWLNSSDINRCASRINLLPHARDNNIGFRCARTPKL